VYKKRLLAAILCVAMLASSGASTTAYAQEGLSIESVSEISTEYDAQEESSSEISLELGEESAAVDESDDAASIEMSADEVDISISDASSEEASIEEEAATDASSQEASVENAAEAASSASSEDVEEISLDDSEVVAYQAGGVASGCFEVNEDGVLRLKNGFDIPKSATIPSEAKVIPSDLFSGSAVIDSVKFEEDSELVEIEAGAFEDSTLTTMYIPKGVTEINDATFKDSQLKTLTFEEKGNITNIGKNAFANTLITTIDLPAVTVVGSSAFSGCPNLKYVNLPALVNIEASAFKNCTNLGDRMAFFKYLKYIGKNAFYGCGFTKVALDSTTDLVIDAQAFENCKSLAEVILPDTLEKIKSRTFYNCTNLTKVTIGTKTGSKTTTIETNAFGNCSKLEDITFFNVKSFASKAFEGCTGIKTIIIWTKDTTSADFEIAEDAFPYKTGVTMKGYNGKVQTYAEKRGYTFISLNAKHKIQVKRDKEKCEVSANVEDASAVETGTKVKVTVTHKSGYLLKSIEINENEPTQLTLVENNDKYQAFTFIMPDTDVVVEVEMAASDKIISKELGYEVRPVNGYTTTYDEAKKIEFFDYVGRQAQFVVICGVSNANWLWSYSSSNPKAVSVSETGLLSATGIGEATITATFKGNSSKKISQKFKVKDKSAIGSIELVLNTPSRARKLVEKAGDEEITVIQYERSALSTGDQKFSVSINAYAIDDADRNIITTSDWKSVDNTIASVSNAKSSTNKNTVTVKKNTLGETLITVSVTNPGTTKVAASASFVVRVVDVTPRLGSSTISVNSLSSVGTQIKLYPVYDYEIIESTLALSKKKVKNKITEYVPIDALCINYSGGAYYIVSSSGKAFTQIYKESTQLYITGKVESPSGEKESFAIPLKELKVTKETLDPTITMKGKINLFYGNSDSLEKYGEVQLTQNIKNVPVKSYKLVSAANHKKDGSEAVDTFANNFDIVKVDDKHFLIKRSSKEMAQKGGKNVVSGYLYLKYEGFNNWVKKPITIPTEETAPGYVLSQTSATVSKFGKDQTFELQLIDKKTKTPIALDNVERLAFTAATTDDLFTDPVVVDDKIVIKVKGTPVKGKAVFYIQMTEWATTLKYTFNLNVTGTLPTVTLASAKAELNKSFKSQSAALKAKTSQKDAEIIGFTDFVYTGKKNIDDGEELLKGISSDGDSIKITLPEKNVAVAKYTFKATPIVKFDNSEDEIPVQPVTFTVNVVEKTASIKLKKSTFSLNTNLKAGSEVVETTYTIGSLPTGFEDYDSITVDTSNVVYVAPANGPALKDIAEVTFENGTAAAKLLAKAKYFEGKTYTYKVSGLRIKAGTDEAVVADFNISIKLNKNAPAVNVKSKGTLNPIDTTTKVTYTATLSNVTSEITNVKIWEKDEYGSWYGGSDVDSRYSDTFELTVDPEKSNVAYLTVKSGKTIVKGQKYGIRLVYTLAVDDSKTYSADFNVIPKQVIPEIKQSRKSAVVYAGQTNRTIEVTLTTVPGKTASSTINAKMLTPEFASTTKKGLKNAFRIKSFDENTGTMTLELVKPSALVLNKAYTLDFVTKYENQAKNSTANKFSLKVTVKK
jgi:hypothetical protein